MKYTPTTIGVTLSLLMLLSCSKPATENEEATDTTAYENTEDPDMQSAEGDGNEGSLEPLREIIDYYGSIDDTVEMAMASFGPLEKVLEHSRRAIYFKDSIEYARQTPDLTDAADIALFEPKMAEAYKVILDYQEAMKTGIKPTDKCPKLIDIVRTPGPSDKSSEYLPEAGRSNTLSRGDFFFMGGAPFIMREQDAVRGPDGNPERRYIMNGTENANYLFNSVYHNSPGAVDVTFGGPLHSYESGQQEVNGVGSLIHTFARRIPLYFLTENGAVKADLLSVNIKLVPEGMGCIRDEPLYSFASGTDLGEYEILGIFIPYAPMSLDRMKIERPQTGVWILDLDGDNVSEFACVSGIFEGISSDQMNEVLWFMNIGGEWRIVDWGADPDCT